VDFRIHAKVWALPCRLQDAEEDSKDVGEVVQEVSQGINSENEAPEPKFPVAVVHALLNP
jgi:hypothetical protein